VIEEEAQPSRSKDLWIASRIRFFLTAPRLSFAQRLSLPVRYFAARMLHKIREKRQRRKIAETGWANPE
jgi:hypothetical protein